MKVRELLEYDTPAIAEYISWRWLQNIMARYVAWKIKRKIKLYNFRQKRKEYLLSLEEKK